MFGGMPDSPRGREIKSVEGSPSGIISRGRDIIRVGTMMETAADTLRGIKENTLSSGAMSGEAIAKLQETIGDSYKTLDEAAELYKPVGPVIVKYGEVLETYKPLIDNSATTCSDLWEAYEALPGDKDGSVEPEADGGVLGIGGHDADSPEAKQEAEDNQAKKQAYDAWENAAERFDTWYDVWEDGYDEAVSGITNGLSGKIEDGFWEVLDDIVAVLEIVAMVVFVIGLFVAGPFAAIALALSAAILLARAVQYCAGECTGFELFTAALDVVPFGKFGKIADGIADLGAGASKLSKFSTGLKFASGLDDAALGRKALGDVMTSIHVGLDISDFARISENANMWKAAGEVHGAMLKHGFSVAGHVNTGIDLGGGSLVDAFN